MESLNHQSTRPWRRDTSGARETLRSLGLPRPNRPQSSAERAAVADAVDAGAFANSVSRCPWGSCGYPTHEHVRTSTTAIRSYDSRSFLYERNLRPSTVASKAETGAWPSDHQLGGLLRIPGSFMVAFVVSVPNGRTGPEASCSPRRLANRLRVGIYAAYTLPFCGARRAPSFPETGSVHMLIEALTHTLNP